MQAYGQPLARGCVRPRRRFERQDEKRAPVARAPEDSDEALVERIRAQDFDALRLLYERYGGQAFAVAYGVISSREAAEEIAQDTFLSVWRHAHTYDPSVGPVRPWLTSIVQNRAIDRLRRKSERRRHLPLDEAWIGTQGSADVFADAYASVQRDQIRTSLAQLPAEQRLAIQGVYYHGNTFAEVADKMGIPTGTVKSRVRLGLAKRRHLLAPMQ